MSSKNSPSIQECSQEYILLFQAVAVQGDVAIFSSKKAKQRGEGCFLNSLYICDVMKVYSEREAGTLLLSTPKGTWHGSIKTGKY